VDPKRQKYRELWWQYAEPCLNMYRSLVGMDRCLAIAQVSNTVMPAFVDPDQVIASMCLVFPYDDDAHFGLMSSAFHWWWAVMYSSTLQTGIRYTPSDVFETFPHPDSSVDHLWSAVDGSGRRLNENRAELMTDTHLGLTKTYNRIHDPYETDSAIGRLRDLHVQLDQAVRDAYGWGDLDLDHHHWETTQGIRFTVSPEARDELLDRLLELNHEKYASEVAAGLHDKKVRKAPAKRAVKAADPSQERML
jgi:hypothetical protein